jgi:putative oxidoreductase
MNILDRGRDAALAVFRIVVGFLFATHGIASLFGVWGGAVGTHGGTEAFLAWPGWFAAVIQAVGGVLVALGVGTRVVALVCSGSMAYAYFTVHQPKGMLPLLNGGEPAALYAWAFVLLAFTGPGAFALGRVLTARSRNVAPVVAMPVQAVAPAEREPVLAEVD